MLSPQFYATDFTTSNGRETVDGGLTVGETDRWANINRWEAP